MGYAMIARLFTSQTAGMVLIALLLFPGTGYGGASGELFLTSGLDTPFVLAEHSGQCYLEVLVQPDTGTAMTGRRLRRPLNLALVIDRSGSMGGSQKLENVKRAAIGMVDRLKPGDYFSLISYGTHVQVHIPAQPVADKHWARSVIARLSPGGSTNLGGGLAEGYRQVQRHYSPKSINRVVLLSDGKANVGISSPRELSSMVMNEAESGVSLSTVGVGLDFNEELMAALSESGHGMYYFIDEPVRINEILAREFHRVEHTMARDIQVRIALEPGFEVEEVFANRYNIQGNSVHVSLGDLAVGDLRRLQLRLRHPAFPPGHHPVARVTMEYWDSEQDLRVPRLQDISLDVGRGGDLVSLRRDRGISERSLVFEAHYARSRAARAVDENNLAEARDILGSMQRHLASAAIESQKVREEIKVLKDYSSALRGSMDQRSKARLQKRIKYKSYSLEGC